jgi:anti-sigma regulatory factor (Ser/Thr protein kinase)
MHDRASFFADRAAYERTYPGMGTVLAEFHVASIAVVPTRSERRPVGALVIAYSKRVSFDAARRVAIEHVADVVGVAIERVMSRERERAAAVRLQESLLGPPVLVEGIGHAARYLPADSALHVGGDWYLAQPLPDGRIAVSIGDVVGRGLDAATVMGQLRSALSAFASRSTNSAVTLDFLDDFARTIPGAISTTVVLARVDLWGHTVEYSSAGHPPPLLVSPDGQTTFLDDAQSCPLAVVPNVRQRPTAAADFPPGSLLLLYSDGLIERRAQSLDEGMDRLECAVREYWNLPLDLLCNALVDDLLDAPRGDDVAILAVRSPVSSQRMLLKKERASPSALAPLRSAMREWLALQGLASNHIDAMLIAAGEATANAIEHAYADGEPGLLRVEATVFDGQVVCCVTDTGTWNEQGRRAGRGNGINVMRDLVDDVTIVRSPRGTSVCLRMTHVAQAESA